MDSSGLGWTVEDLALEIEGTSLVNYFTVASATILTLDWILTFDLEVSLIWGSPWNVSKALFLLARYFPFLDIALAMYHSFGYAIPGATCQRLFDSLAWVFVIGMAAVEMIFTLRTWAVWGRGKVFTYVLASTFGALWIAIFVIVHFYLKSTGNSLSPFPGVLLGCVLSVWTPILSVCYIMLMVYDACLLGLMLIRGVAALRSTGDVRLMRVVCSDGIIYYIYVFALSLVNTLIIVKLPFFELQTLLLLLERVVHAVLACRVVLHIRNQAKTPELETDVLSQSHFVVARREVMSV